ncbi:hypothetical protein MIND_00622500 [Mycena indigotica]|uniref:Uncharacterized protein n=1 Tax=Mycena indigotica TaxID=2126181 RepID=A0A8H6SQ33_9AGAR|nr:uncharacterized protein MIND_00622500 [Mycena indigotica]KAF7303920.1 hypothetical protein MIND_00622500 [Mycena indigotica]
MRDHESKHPTREQCRIQVPRRVMDFEFDIDHQSTLPSEIERSIFEMVASSSYESIPAMRLVAWRVNEWVEPFFYCGLWVDYDCDYAKPGWSPDALTADIVRRPNFYRDNVKSVWLGIDKVEQHAAAQFLLAACSNIETLEICRGYPTSMKNLLDHVLALGGTLKRLHVDMKDLSSKYGKFQNAELNNLFDKFGSITHLELKDVSLPFEICSRLERLPRLTHLALTYDLRMRGTLTSLYTIFQTCKKLVVCVGLQEVRRSAKDSDLGSGYQAMDYPHYVDNNNPRFVLVRYVHKGWDDPKAWLKNARENEVPGYWPCAEAMVAQRLALLNQSG